MPLPKLVPSSQTVEYQETDFTHDALGRHICNSWQEATTNPNFDVVIVGSGMYGGYCAAKLYRGSESLGLRILVLEAGGLLVPEHVQNLTQMGFDVPGPIAGNQDNGLPRNIVWGLPWRGNQSFPGLAYCVGGKSLYWGGWSPRLTDADLADWPTPVADYLRGIYDTVEEEIGVEPKADYINGPLCDALKTRIMGVLANVMNLDSVDNAPLAVQGEPPALGLFSFDKFSSAPILVSAIRDAIAKSGANDVVRRLFLVPRAHVTRLKIDSGRVSEVEVHVNGIVQTLALSPSASIVLAASAIESTRLALESFPTPLMGRNLMAHLRSDLTVRIRRSVILSAVPTELEIAALLVRGHTSRGQFHHQITASAAMGGASDRHLFNMIPDLEVIEELTRTQDPEWIPITLRGIAEMKGFRNGTPSDRSWMDLSPYERDQFGNRRAYVNIVATSDEQTLWDEMDAAAVDLAEEMAGGAGDVQYWYDNAWQAVPPSVSKRREGQFRRGLGTTYHESGTLWMGNDAASSVTDVNGRFHHISNAYCADQALFPTVGSANPSLHGLSLARQVSSTIIAARTPVVESGFDRIALESLANWRMAGSGRFRIVDHGVFESEGGIGLLWYDREEFDNFVLKLEWRAFNADDNSGVFIRIPALGNSDPANDWRPAAVQGYEIQIDDRGYDPNSDSNGSPLHRTGAIYELAAAAVLPSQSLGQWNEFEIEAADSSIRVQFNGHEASRLGDGSRRARGFIGLQNHHPGSRVQFRNLRIKRL